MSAHNLFDMRGRRALVTGASRGLGLEIASALAQQGAAVVLHARPKDAGELAAAAERVRAQSGSRVDVWVHDLLEVDGPDGIGTALDKVEGACDVLVNNAGASWAEPAQSHGLEPWRRLLELNLTATFVLTQEVGRRWMLPKAQGRILNIASVAGLRGNSPLLQMNTVAYNASKGGVVNLTRALAVEWGPSGIQVNAICPGFFPTRLTSGTLERASEEILTLTPLRRIGQPEDIRGIAVLLCSDAGRHISGQCIALDGGLSAA